MASKPLSSRIKGWKSRAGAGVPKPLRRTIGWPCCPFRYTCRTPLQTATRSPYAGVPDFSARSRIRFTAVESRISPRTTRAAIPARRSPRRGLICLGGLGKSSRAHDFVTHERLGAFHPGVVAGRNGVGVAGAYRGPGAVLHLHRKRPRSTDPDVVDLAAVRVHHGLDGLGPPPARLESKPAQGGVSDADHIDGGLGRTAPFIGFVE